MPPKQITTILAKIQQFRDTYNDAEVHRILDRWLQDVIPTLSPGGSFHNLLHTTALPPPSPTPEAAVPEVILTGLSNYQTILLGLLQDINVIKGVIAVRIPELKEEDNLGVNVQVAVFEQLEKFERFALGASSGGSSSDAPAPYPGFTFKREYLGGRATLEGKLIGGKEDEEDSKNNDDKEKAKKQPKAKAPSLTLQLIQFDQDAWCRLGLAADALLQWIIRLIALLGQNLKRLLAPREAGGRMVC